MKPLEWRKIPRDEKQGRWVALHVTLNPKGIISLSRTTFEKMGKPKAVFLFFDKINSRIGLQPTSPSLKDAYTVVSKGKGRPHHVHVYRLIQEENIKLPATVQFYDAEINREGILSSTSAPPASRPSSKPGSEGRSGRKVRSRPATKVKGVTQPDGVSSGIMPS